MTEGRLNDEAAENARGTPADMFCLTGIGTIQESGVGEDSEIVVLRLRLDD